MPSSEVVKIGGGQPPQNRWNLVGLSLRNLGPQNKWNLVGLSLSRCKWRGLTPFWNRIKLQQGSTHHLISKSVGKTFLRRPLCSLHPEFKFHVNHKSFTAVESIQLNIPRPWKNWNGTLQTRPAVLHDYGLFVTSHLTSHETIAFYFSIPRPYVLSLATKKLKLVMTCLCCSNKIITGCYLIMEIRCDTRNSTNKR